MGARPARRRQTVFVGSKIRHIRKARGLTQSDLAKRIGVQQSDLCRMETGEYKVSLDTLLKILGVFEIRIGEFFQDESAGDATAAARESELMRLFRRLDATGQEEILDFLRYKGTRRPGSWRTAPGPRAEIPPQG